MSGTNWRNARNFDVIKSLRLLDRQVLRLSTPQNFDIIRFSNIENANVGTNALGPLRTRSVAHRVRRNPNSNPNLNPNPSPDPSPNPTLTHVDMRILKSQNFEMLLISKFYSLTISKI